MGRRVAPASLIDGHPLMVRWLADRDALLEQRASVEAQADRFRRERDDALQAYDAKVKEAVASKTVVPKRPVVDSAQHLDDALRAVDQMLRDHDARKQATVAQIAEDGGLVGARDRVKEIQASAVDDIRRMEEWLAEARAALRVEADLLSALELFAHPDRVHSNASADLIQRVQALTLDEFARCSHAKVALDAPVVAGATLVEPDPEEHAAGEAAQQRRQAEEMRVATMRGKVRGLTVQADPFRAFGDGTAAKVAQARTVGYTPG